MLTKFMRFFTGFVRFRAFGGFGERFINLCSQNDILLWDVETLGDEIFATTSIEGYKKIRSAAKGSGMKAQIVKKSGLPFIVFRYRKRIGIPVGTAFFIIMLCFLSTRIWLIDVDGCRTVLPETVISAVEQAGLKTGCSVFSADPVKASLAAGRAVDGIADIKINIIGSRATIKIKEREKIPSIENNSGMYDLVASKDAQLIVLEPYCGTQIAGVLNTVLKGETLISGVVANKDESTGYVHASGYAVGRAQTTVNAEVNSGEKFRKIREIKKRYSIYFLGLEIPVGRAAESRFILKSEKFISYSGKKMPVGIFCTEYSGLTKTENILTQKQAELVCVERYAQAAKNYTENRQLISERSGADFNGKTKSVSGVFDCYENIGIEREFGIEESGSSQ